MSAILVQNTIRRLEPDMVMVELDASRVSRMPAPTTALGGGSGNPPRDRRSFRRNSNNSSSNNSSSNSGGGGSAFGPMALERVLKGLYKQMDDQGFQSGDE
eukprot:CAMPEP_0171806122 /NCGR_PEP_ID=MMETSP0991-20121206/75123_1 /TAXON_ID=483369 /ORGANISM="non described non described, Strain CCMP2098" /LENGTH=100 /DNA_ID=CAMNT_0012418835 /DNA_START=298 /DNA_END=598 /DNA_ORIENTATION=+